MSSSREIPLTSFAWPTGSAPRTILARAFADVDGDDWGEIPLSETQARLVEEDDLAILQLWVDLEIADPIEFFEVEVNDIGLRTLDMGGTYCVPVRDADLPEGHARYKLESALEPGVHRLQWSYVWNPPADSEGNALDDGVTLTPPIVRHLVADASGVLRKPTAEPDVAALSAGSLDAELECPISIQVTDTSLRVEASHPGGIQAFLDDQELPQSPPQSGTFAIPPATEGAHTLRLKLSADGGLIRRLSLQ